MNNVVLMGRLTADPELRQTQSGISSCRFTIAVNRKFKNKDTDQYDADFISCVAWRQTAEFVSRYFSKGSMICVSGSLRTGSYQDKNHSDVTHYTTDVMVDGVEFTGEKKQQGTSNNQQPQQQRPQQQQQQPAPQYTPHNALEAGQSWGNLSDFEEILSDGDVPF
jgi:single-strand DNA-binding protein